LYPLPDGWTWRFYPSFGGWKRVKASPDKRPTMTIALR